MLSLCSLARLRNAVYRKARARPATLSPSIADSLLPHSGYPSSQLDYRNSVGADNVVKSPFPDIVSSEKSLFRHIYDRFPKHGRNTALIDGENGREFSFAKLEELIAKTSSALNKSGFKRGDVMALCAPNIPEYAVLFFSVLGSGGVVSTCNPSYKANELAYQFKNSGASVIATIPQILPEVQKAAEEAGVKEIIVIDDSGQTSHSEGLVSYHDLISDSGSRFDMSLAGSADDIAILPYSSGTTGLPKGVMLTNRNVVSNTLQADHPQLLDLSHENMTLLGVLPFFHIYGMVAILFSSLYFGCKTVTLPRFDPEMFLATIQRYRVTKLYCVPPIILFMAKHPIVENYDLSSLADVMSASAPLATDVVRAAKERLVSDCIIRQGYGLTETSSVSHVLPIELAESFKKPGSVGVPLMSMKCKIVDPETLQTLPVGEKGEVWMAGPTIMKGYLNNEQATRDMITEDGWLRSGDIGYFNDEGCFYITDRLKELIKVKGFQVPPAELEALLVTHDKIF